MRGQHAYELTGGDNSEPAALAIRRSWRAGWGVWTALLLALLIVGTCTWNLEQQ